MSLTKTFSQVFGIGDMWRRAIYDLVDEVNTKVEGIDTDLDSGNGRYFMRTVANAAKTDASPCVFQAPSAGTVTAFTFIPDGTVSQNDTDYLTVDLRDAAGNLMVTAKNTKITGGVAFAANTPISFTMNSTHKVMTSGEVAEFSIVNAGSTGVAFPGGMVVVDFEST